MQFLLTTFVAVVVAVASMFGVYNYVPLATLGFENEGVQKFGASITTLNGSDRLSDSRTTINDNFTSLNNGKIENSSSTIASITTLSNLTTIGTIISGIWNGTAVTAPYGGTGSTTLSSNQVLLGNGTGNIKTVSGWGITNQILTSQGAGNAPTWTTTLSLTSDNVWTGQNLFTVGATTTRLVASSTPANPLILNTVSYSTPSTQGASSTALINNGSGLLQWQATGSWTTIVSSTTPVATSTWAFSNLGIQNYRYLRIYMYIPSYAVAAARPSVFFNSDVGANYSYNNRIDFQTQIASVDGGATKMEFHADSAATTTPMVIQASGINIAGQKKLFTCTVVYQSPGASPPTGGRCAGQWNESTNAIHTITFLGGNTASFGANTTIRIEGSNNND